MTIQDSGIKASCLLVLLSVLVVPSVTLAQSTSDEIPRLANGQPDIQGT